MTIPNRAPGSISLLPTVLGLALLSGCGAPSSGEKGAAAELLFTPRATEVTVPSGTVLTVEFTQSLSSDVNQVGDAFVARVIDPVRVGERVAIDAGSVVTGRVAEAVPSKKFGGQARLSLDFNALQLGSGNEVAIDAALHTQAKSQTKKDAATIGGATAGGAVLGRIIGHQKDKDANGTAVGAIVGAAVGTGVAASNRGEPATIPAGTVVHLRLDSPVRLTAQG